MIFEIIKSDHFLIVKEIVDRANSNQPKVDHISQTTVWRFIRSQGFWINCLYKKIFFDRNSKISSQKVLRTKYWQRLDNCYLCRWNNIQSRKEEKMLANAKHSNLHFN